MIELNEQNKNLILKNVREGNIILVLGAGASHTSCTSNGDPIPLGKKLAKILAEEAGHEYQDESLTKVVSATVGTRISDDKFHEILREQYTSCMPSEELVGLLNFSWHRLYTWNIDDTLDACPRGAQKRRSKNGMSDSVVPHSDTSILQVIYLHGEAEKPEHGFIFSEREYNDAIRYGHDWYRQLSIDYSEKMPIFVGSTLDEPILGYELDRARANKRHGLGLAFLITPDKLTPLEYEDLEARKITHVEGELKDFVDFLKSELHTDKISPEEVIENKSYFARRISRNQNLSARDLDTAKFINIIAHKDSSARIGVIDNEELRSRARSFLEGAPPDWQIVTHGVPVRLQQTADLYTRFLESYYSDDRAFLVFGQSGSGKTTAIMQVILELIASGENPPIYELTGETPSLIEAIRLLVRLHPDEKVIVYFGQAFIFGDAFAVDISSFDSGKLFFIGDARSQEWRGRIKRRFNSVAFTAFNFQRFGEGDYEPLTALLEKYVPAPSFTKLPRDQQVEKLKKSNNQLLIALKEATHSKSFRKVITEEFQALKSDEAKAILLLVGLSTLSRTGIGIGMLREAFSLLYPKDELLSRMTELSGIVFYDRNSRLIARHDVYIRHIIENVANPELLVDIFSSLISTFTKYEVPVVKTAPRQEALLFKYLLNHDLIHNTFRRKGRLNLGEKVYSDFEIEFQSDGHYWLQYGQYLTAIGKKENAIPVLEKSIDAYSENIYAVHALADLQLKVVYESTELNSHYLEMVANAVASLWSLHQSNSTASDQYPIVTLSYRHVPLLLKFPQLGDAIKTANEYFREVEEMLKENRTKQLFDAKKKLILLLTKRKT